MAVDKRSVRVGVPTNKAGPGLGHVGVFAVVCFALGVLWPTLGGVTLVPEPPGKARAEEKKASPRPPHSGFGDAPAEPVPVSKATPAPTLTQDARIQIERSLVVNCRDAQDRRLASCDEPGFDGVAKDRILALSTCPAAEFAAGTLSLGFDLDFATKKIRKLLRGKSTTVPDDTAEALVECAKREFLSATLQDVAFTHPRYLVFYVIRFVPAGTPEVALDGENAVVKASGSASIIWNSARIRSEPEAGEVKARLLYGTKVFVTGRRGDWYRVRYDARGSEGWVHKNALAL